MCLKTVALYADRILVWQYSRDAHSFSVWNDTEGRYAGTITSGISLYIHVYMYRVSCNGVPVLEPPQVVQIPRYRL